MTLHWQLSSFDELKSEELYQLLRLRQQVFVVEQDCAYLDLDNLDQLAMHILCWQHSTLVAYARCLAPGQAFPESSLGRVIVSTSARGRQLGRRLVQKAIEHNQAQWPDYAIRIGAQAYLEVFYSSLGFVSEGSEYLEDGIPHIHMVLSPAVG